MEAKYVREKIERGGKEFEVIDETDTDYAVEAPFDYADGTTKLLKLWWDKKYCTPIKCMSGERDWT
jgi:hypothetical protein